MPNSEGYNRIDLGSLIDQIIQHEKKNAQAGNRSEVSDEVNHLVDNMHKGEMTETTAVTICASFIVTFSALGTESLRIEFGHALREMMVTNSQNASTYASCAKRLLELSLKKLIESN